MMDNFDKWAYREDNSINVLWRIRISDGHFVHEDLFDYPKKIFCYSIDFIKFKEFVERLNKFLMCF
jgi:hypothetical protein